MEFKSCRAKHDAIKKNCYDKNVRNDRDRLTTLTGWRSPAEFEACDQTSSSSVHHACPYFASVAKTLNLER
jgi:hypothetical protein